MPNKLRHVLNRWKHQLFYKTTLTHLVYYPPVLDKNTLDDQYYRALWYLHPLAKQVQTITMIIKGDIRPSQTVPELLDPSIKAFAQEMSHKFVFISAENTIAIKDALKKSDAILLTSPKNKDLISSLPLGKCTHVIDHQSYKSADSNYLNLTALGMGSNKAEMDDCKKRLRTVIEKMRAPVGYILGTGPLLAEMANHDYSDGGTIACNTMVKNKPLMERLQPKLIVMGDPIFHAGCSVFAGDLRKHLIDAMKRYDADLIVPWRDYRVYRDNLEPSLRNRIIGIPYINPNSKTLPNLDLQKHHFVTTTANILTLFLLPLAATLFDTIRIAGCDGRPIEENNYFWKHDPSSQLTGRMDDIKAAHPAFFKMSYDDYYEQHCKTLARWLDTIESQGKQIENLTPSYIPALQSREKELAYDLRKKLGLQKSS